MVVLNRFSNWAHGHRGCSQQVREENHTNNVWMLKEKTKAGKEKGSGCFQAV